MSAAAAPRPAARTTPARLELLALGAIVLAAALLRFWNLDSQSYWHDEATTVRVVRDSFLDVFSHDAATESTPPLYYVLAWVWGKAVGLGEGQLRSLSAVAGTLTVPVAWAAVREVAPRTWGPLAAAALVAVNPSLVWYGQEARAYALLVLVTGVALWLCLRARRTGQRRDLWLWAGAAALSLCTHYFAVFVLLPQVLLLWRGVKVDRRQVVRAAGAVGLVGVALAPLAAHQSASGNAGWIGESDLGARIGELVRELAYANTDLISSNSTAPHGSLRVLALAGLVAAVIGGLAATRDERRALAPLALVALAGIAVPLVLVVTPVDVFKDRNLLAAWIPWYGAMGVALTVARLRGLGLLGVAAVGLAAMQVNYDVVTDPSLQRKDWRGLGAALEQPVAPRAVAIFPNFGAPTLEFYGHPLVPMPATARVRELVLAGEVGDRGVHPPPIAGFRFVEARQVGALWFVRYRRGTPYAFGRRQVEAPAARLYLERG